MHILTEASEAYYAEHKVMRRLLFLCANLFDLNFLHKQVGLTLFLDDVDRLAKQRPDFLIQLQQYAYDQTNRGHLLFVFGSSEGLAPILMQSKFY